MITKLLDTTPPTAAKAVDLLESLGILEGRSRGAQAQQNIQLRRGTLRCSAAKHRKPEKNLPSLVERPLRSDRKVLYVAREALGVSFEDSSTSHEKGSCELRNQPGELREEPDELRKEPFALRGVLDVARKGLGVLRNGPLRASHGALRASKQSSTGLAKVLTGYERPGS